MKWKFFCALLPVLVLTRPVSATVAYAPTDSTGNFDPYTSYTYTVPPGNLPTFDATNFVIDGTGSFTVNFADFSVNNEYYEPLNVQNYTNNGTMMANSGFRFDTKTTNLVTPHVLAKNFNNSGTISGDSVNDSAANLLLFENLGQILVNASNVVNSGTLDVGADGFINVSGDNLNLDGGTFSIESLLGTNFIYDVATFSGFGTDGSDTSSSWNPFQDLTPTEALTSPPYQYQFLLTNSTPYFDVRYVGNSQSNVIIRMVFIENANTNVPVKVYFDDPQASFGNGTAYIEWDGNYLDPATGNTITDYLYMNDNYMLSVNTNETFYNGLPSAFEFVSSPTPILAIAPTAAGFVNNLLPDAIYTNRYTYMSGDIVDVTSPTNASTLNPSGALTNLYSRVQIYASNELTMAGAQISGPNYISITCTNQFDGSAGASISSPYTDLNLGVTNGFLTISNLLMANIPQWNGPVTAWSTRFLAPNVLGGTNDYRVLVVYDNVQPTTGPWIHNLNLYATNSLVISDVLNVYNQFYANAQSLTLTTNLIGVGASSVDGELHWDSGAGFGTTQMPNLLWLTNNGEMTSLNNISFANNYNNYTFRTTNFTTIVRSHTNAVVATVLTNVIPSGWLGALINNSLITNTTTLASALNFTNAGNIYCGSGSFILSAGSANFVNGSTLASGDVTVTTTNLLLANEYINAGHALKLTAVGAFTDGQSNLVVNGLTNGNVWLVGANAVGGGDSGFNALSNPFQGDLLGTTVTNLIPSGKKVYNTWAGADRGYSNSGFSNNLAVGYLVLDAVTNTAQFNFAGTNTTGGNAIYVDCLELRDAATNVDKAYNPTLLKFATNFNIYYAQAIIGGVSVAEKLNGKGIDSSSTNSNNHLRWVPGYIGYFSYTNLVYPNGTTNAVNAALAQSGDITSGGISQPNSQLPTQIFVPSEINLAITITNKTARRLTWNIPSTATNYYVQYLTNLLVPNWVTLTNFNISSSAIPTSATNAFYVDTNRPTARFYRVGVNPWLTYPR